MEKGNEELWRDVLQRLTAIESNTKGLDEVSKKANAAYAMALSNSDDIAELKEAQKANRTWLMGLLATVVGYVIMNYLLR
ncbi:MAG: holin [Bacilli bacterium]